ncbi:hypothetical protein [Hydrogenimonas sp.]
MVVVQVVSFSVHRHGKRNSLVGVFEALHDIAITVVYGQKCREISPEIALGDRTVDLFGRSLAQGIRRFEMASGGVEVKRFCEKPYDGAVGLVGFVLMKLWAYRTILRENSVLKSYSKKQKRSKKADG